MLLVKCLGLSEQQRKEGEFPRGGSWAGSCFPSKNCLEEERGVSLRGRGSSARELQEMKEAACLVKSRFFLITAQFFLFFFQAEISLVLCRLAGVPQMISSGWTVPVDEALKSRTFWAQETIMRHWECGFTCRCNSSPGYVQFRPEADIAS